jgi:hypothetical protein
LPGWFRKELLMAWFPSLDGTILSTFKIGRLIKATLSTSSLTASRSFTLPDRAGTFALTQLAENEPILLDASLSADGTYSGICEAGTAGETLAFGESVYFKAADSRWWKTDADSATTSGGVKVAICVSSGTAGGALTVLLFGKIRADSLFPTMTVGASVFLSQTAGAITSTQPTGTDVVVRVAGFANTADELFWYPSPDYLTLN